MANQEPVKPEPAKIIITFSDPTKAEASIEYQRINPRYVGFQLAAIGNYFLEMSKSAWSQAQSIDPEPTTLGPAKIIVTLPDPMAAEAKLEYQNTSPKYFAFQVAALGHYFLTVAKDAWMQTLDETRKRRAPIVPLFRS